MGRTKTTVHHGNILVAQSSAAVRERTARILEAEGYRVYLATSGNDALEIWKVVSTEIDLLLADLELTGISGSELAGVLCALKPGLKVLLYGSEPGTGRPQMPQHFQLLEKLRKPELIEAVKKALDED